MDRKKILTTSISTLLILLIFFGARYIRKCYLSNEQCTLKTLRDLYGAGAEKAAEIKDRDYIITLYADMDSRTIYTITTKKAGFLYYTDFAMVYSNLPDEDPFYVLSDYSSDGMTMEIFIYRNNPSITKMEACFDDGTKYTFEEWDTDFIGFSHAADGWVRADYTGYDCEGNIIWTHQLIRSFD